MTDPITTWDDESIADLISDTMSDTNDMDVRFSDFARATVKELREKGLLPSVEGAQAVLQAECDRLTAELVAKGYPAAHTEIWIGWLGREVVVQIHPGGNKKFPARVSLSSFGRDSILEACEKVRETIATMPDPDIECDPNLCDAWFSVPMAEAAE